MKAINTKLETGVECFLLYDSNSGKTEVPVTVEEVQTDRCIVSINGAATKMYASKLDLVSADGLKRVKREVKPEYNSGYTTVVFREPSTLKRRLANITGYAYAVGNGEYIVCYQLSIKGTPVGIELLIILKC